MAKDQMILLPRENYFDWVTAVRGYVLTYGVKLTPDPAVAGRAKVVTAPSALGLFAVGDLNVWFRQNAPAARLDLVPAATPAEFGNALYQRIENRDRYGEASKPFTLAWPTDYNQILQPFGVNPDYYRRYGLPGHEGVDIRAPMGSNIYACADGEVFEVNDGSGNHPYGIHIRIKHRHGFQTLYAYLSQALVNVNDKVATRQVIGKAGMTGNISTPQLHLTLKQASATATGLTNFPKDIVDPTPYLVIPPGWVPGPQGPEGVDYGTPANKCLVGVHCRADGRMAEADFTAIKLARVEAVKLLTISGSEDVDRLRQINPKMFLIVRMHADFTNRVVRPADFAHWMEGDMLPFYSKGLRYFEVHNEPNLAQEGWRHSWQDGREFGAWFLDVVARLKARFPEVKFGYPGLSPGGDVSGIRLNSNAFMAGSDDAIHRADWIGAHSYWVNEASMTMSGAGQSWEEVRKRYPTKQILITEFSNPNDAQDMRTKGQQYVRYYRSLRDEPGIGAAFAFALSASTGYAQEVWRREDGRVTDIAREVGSRTF